MNSTFRVRLLAVAISLATLVAANNRSTAQVSTAAPALYSQGNPTAEEQYLLEKLNRARLDPAGEGQRLAAWLRTTPTGEDVSKYYQVDADQVISDFAAMSAVAPLAFNADLIVAAEAHSADLVAHGGFGPNDDPDVYWDGASVDQHVFASGYRTVAGVDGFAGGCAFGGASDLDEIHAGYLVDWGNSDLGHRKLEMTATPSFQVVGMGLGTIPTGQNPYGNLAHTEYYGSNASKAPFLTGVVYADANANGQYDVGEGVAGVTVTVDGGAYYAVTSTSGGYALPLVRADGTTATGTVTVHMTGLPGGATRDSTIALSAANVKWDAMVAQAPASNPSAATLLGGGEVSQVAKDKLTVLVQRPSGSDATQPLAVSLTYKGTAVAGVDYKALPGTVTIPAGAVSGKLKVKALGGDSSGGAATLNIKVKGQKSTAGKTTVTFVP